jgi:hypothetical protein
MKNTIGLVALGAMLAACGGGGDGGNNNTGNPATGGTVGNGGTTSPPPVAVTPEVKVLSGSVVRYAAEGSSVAFDVQIKPNFTPAGTLVVVASDKAGVINAPVAVTANTDGSYALALDTAGNATRGHYSGDITLKLCADAACATPQTVASVTVPYDMNVVAYGTAWPGDKLTALAPWTDVPDWSTFHGNAGHTGYMPVEIKPEQLLPRWKAGAISQATVSSYGYGYAATLVAANGIFYGAGDNVLKARKEHDGSLVWSYDVAGLPYPSVNPPAVANGVVYMSAGQNTTYMFGFDAATGAVRFRTPTGPQWDTSLAPVALDDAVYTIANYGGVYAFKPTGDQLFQFGGSQNALWTPALDANQVYVYNGSTLSILDRKTGSVRSTIRDVNASPYTYQTSGAPVLGANGNLFVANYGNATQGLGTGNELLKFDTAKGYVDWRFKGSYPLTPAYAEGVVYVQNLSPYRIEARAETDGALQWSWVPGAASETAWNGEPIVTKNLLFVSASKASYAIDLRTHKVVWSYPMAGRLALTRSGILYIQSQEAVVAFNVK